jgi:hypothetical protein
MEVVSFGQTDCIGTIGNLLLAASMTEGKPGFQSWSNVIDHYFN